jgi:large subunit ribosomal protein L30
MSGILLIKLTKSVIGRPEKHRKVVKSLGLKKLNQVKELPDTPSTRGMINTVSHLVTAEEK